MDQCSELHRIEMSPCSFRSHVGLWATFLAFGAIELRTAILNAYINQFCLGHKVDFRHKPICIKTQ